MKLNRTLTALSIASVAVILSVQSHAAPLVIKAECPVTPEQIQCESDLMTLTAQNGALLNSIRARDVAITERDQALAALRSSNAVLQTQLVNASTRTVVLDIGPATKRLSRLLRQIAKGDKASILRAARVTREIRDSTTYNNSVLTDFGFPLAKSGLAK